jgi:hypothetical protein
MTDHSMSNPTCTTTSFSTNPRSTEMYTLHEALAREHLRQLHQDARRRALVGELASANRWRFLERRAHAAYQRHAQRAAQSLSAVAH